MLSLSLALTGGVANISTVPSPSRPAFIATAEAGGIAFAAREWDRAAAQQGSWFDYDLADQVVVLWPRIFRHTSGDKGGLPFDLALWQEVILRLLVGWKIADGTRLFRTLILWIARGNGKTEFLAALALMFWLIDGEYAGRGYVFAATEDQAKDSFERMSLMVALSPELSAKIVPQAKSLFCQELMARFEVLTSKAGGKHGKNASVLFSDEIHEQVNGELYDVLHKSTSKRRQPMELMCSTAGFDKRSYGGRLFDQCRRIADGLTDAPDTLAIIFAADEEDEWTDPSTWRKASPNLGVSPSLRFVESECEKAKDDPSAEANFRAYYLNQWPGSSHPVIRMPLWDAAVLGRTRWPDIEQAMKGRRCWGGLDISSSEDLTALAWLFEPDTPDGPYTALMRVWCPADNIHLRSKRDRVEYDRWHRAGALIKTEGNTIDMETIRSQVMADAEVYDVQLLNVDRMFQGRDTGQWLADHGVSVNFHGQGFLSMGPAMRDFRILINGGRINHGGHPVLRWSMENLRVKKDDAGNEKPSKKMATEKIDPALALIMATSGAFKAQEEVPMISFDAMVVM